MRTTRALTFATALLTLGACDFAPNCPAGTTYDYGIRRCRVTGETPDSGPPDEVDSGADEEDAGSDEDSGTADDAGGDDGGTADAGGDDAGPDDGGDVDAR